MTSAGNLIGATEHASAMLPLWERLRHLQYGSRALYAVAAASYMAGDFNLARGFSNRGLSAAPRDPRTLGSRTLLEYNQGNFEAGRTYLDRFIEVARQSVPGPNTERGLLANTIPAVIHITGVADLAHSGEQTIKAILESSTSTPGITAFARIGSSLLSAFQQDAVTAAENYTELAESQAVGFGSLSGMPAGRLLGLLASTAGRFEQAVDHFEEGLSFCRNGGYRPALAWTCHDYAEALLNTSAGPGRSEAQARIKVMSLLDEALALSSEMGMRPLNERVVALQQRAAMQLGPEPTYPDGLTVREVEVLRLIASGLSNREIGADLVLSTRTVERHITNIYGKIGARGRADATGYALGHGLLDEK